MNITNTYLKMVQFPFVAFEIQHLADAPLIYVYGGHLEFQNGDQEFFIFFLLVLTYLSK